MDEAQRTWLYSFLGRSPGGGGASIELERPAAHPAARYDDVEPADEGAAPPAADPDRAKVLAAIADFNKRYGAIPNPFLSFETSKPADKFVAGFNAMLKPKNAGDFKTAAGLLAGIEASLSALEAAIAAMPKKAKGVSDEAARIGKLKDKDLKALSVADKSAMVRTLLGAGKPTGAARAAQIKVFNAMELDRGFLKKDEERGDAIADELKGNKELKTARKGWKTASEADKIKAIEKVVAVQSKHLGIPPPKVVIEHNPPSGGLITNGYFSPDDGMLHINLDPASSVQNFQRAIDLAIHENAHNYQDQLVKRLEDGKLKPGDAEYDQAQMFAVNALNPGGYITGAEDFTAYQSPFRIGLSTGEPS